MVDGCYYFEQGFYFIKSPILSVPLLFFSSKTTLFLDFCKIIICNVGNDDKVPKTIKFNYRISQICKD